MYAVELLEVSKKYNLFKKSSDRIKEFLSFGKRKYHEEFWALNDITIQVEKGTTLGIVGDNGAGKTTLLKIIARLIPPTSGEVKTYGSISTLLNLGGGFHKDFSGKDNIYMNCSLLGMSEKEIEKKYKSILEFSELGDFINQPVKVYSSGMYVRLGFSIAINIEPDILLIDEVIAVGDLKFRKKCLQKIREFQNLKKTIIIVSHSLPDISALSHYVVWLDKGRIRHHGTTEEVVESYLKEIESNEKYQSSQWNLLQHNNIHRTNSKEVEIKQVDFLNGDGKRSNVFKTGGELRLHIHYKANQKVTNPLFRVQFFSGDGIFIFGTNNYRHGLNLESIEGEGIIEVFFPKFSLLYGKYFVSVGIFPDEYKSAVTETAYDYHHMKYNIQVNSLRQDGGGWVFNECRWSTIK